VSGGDLWWGGGYHGVDDDLFDAGGDPSVYDLSSMWNDKYLRNMPDVNPVSGLPITGSV
jgi:hypothetical protein